jgi:hypothetical protein
MQLEGKHFPAYGPLVRTVALAKRVRHQGQNTYGTNDPRVADLQQKHTVEPPADMKLPWTAFTTYHDHNSAARPTRPSPQCFSPPGLSFHCLAII